MALIYKMLFPSISTFETPPEFAHSARPVVGRRSVTPAEGFLCDPVFSIVLQSLGGSSTYIEGTIDGAHGPKRSALGSPGSRLGRNHRKA